MITVAQDADYQRVNNLLWRYRPCLDRFEFLLEMQLMVSASGRTDWLHHVTDLLDELAETMNELDLEREVVLGTSSTISDLVDGAPEPWPTILTEQLAHFGATTTRINRLRRRNQQMMETATTGLSRLFEAIAEAAGHNVASHEDSYDGEGRLRSSGASSLLFDGRV
jgi:hypothetical protein